MSKNFVKVGLGCKVRGDTMVCNGEILIKIECNADDEDSLIVYEDNGGISIELDINETMLPYICLTDEDVLRLVEVLTDYSFKKALEKQNDALSKD